MATYRYSRDADDGTINDLTPDESGPLTPEELEEREKMVRERKSEQPPGPRAHVCGYVNEQKTPPEVKKGPRGGRYTEAKTKEGRPYRRYF